MRDVFWAIVHAYSVRHAAPCDELVQLSYHSLAVDTGVERQVQALSVKVIYHVKAAELHSVA